MLTVRTHNGGWAVWGEWLGELRPVFGGRGTPVWECIAYIETQSLAEEFDENGLRDVADHLREHGAAATRVWIDGVIEEAREEDQLYHHGEGWELGNLEVARERLTMLKS